MEFLPTQILPSAMFLDRDGVINQEVHHLGDPALLELIPGAAVAIAKLNALSIPAIVITNQSGVARGYYTETDVNLVHRSIQQLLASAGAHIDRFYYCPHHPTAGIGTYRTECTCRKPQPGMLLQAAQDYNLDLTNCYLVGDKDSDIMAGWAVGCKTMLVKTGHGMTHLQNWQLDRQPDWIGDDLLQVINLAISEESK
jgi:D-glycero-D-manno-heptose 1,7-bisphosphate phosphatase